MEPMSSLGSQKIHRQADYTKNNIARVSSVERFDKYGIIDVVFLDHGQPFPVWVVNDIDREPVTGDQVIIGYINGRKDAPYLEGYVKNFSYTTNFIKVSKDRIRIQLPVFEIGKKDGLAHKDVEAHLLDEGKLKSERAYVELAPDHALISFPTKGEPITVKLTSGSIDMVHPKQVNITGGDINLSGNNIALTGSTITANGEDLTVDLT